MLSSRLLVASYLESWGYQPVEAKNGKEALGILSQDMPPRIVIADWLMPVMTGVDLGA